MNFLFAGSSARANSSCDFSGGKFFLPAVPGLDLELSGASGSGFQGRRGGHCGHSAAVEGLARLGTPAGYPRVVAASCWFRPGVVPMGMLELFADEPLAWQPLCA